MEKEIYRIKKGTLKSEKFKIPFDFGIVTSLNKIFFIELYVNEQFDLNDFMGKYRKSTSNSYFQIDCLTEHNNLLEIYQLSINEIKPSISKLKLVCYDKIIHTEVNENYNTNDSEIENNKDIVRYLVLEGLRLEFSDFTQKEITRNGIIINELNDLNRDHTSFIINTNNSFYHLIFSKSDDGEDINVEFNDKYPNVLSYSHYLKIKNNFTSLLSLINGAEVKVRKECAGSYYTEGRIDSEIVHTYSFEKVINKRYHRYVPINNPFNRGDNILNIIFNSCFQNYCELNHKINLDSVIYYLTSSQQAKSIQEKVFVQMIAFERLTTQYANNISGLKMFFSPESEEFKPIKDELLSVIEKHREKFGDSYNTIKSKIGNLNQIKRLNTTEKMYKIINDAKIEINTDIENLVEICRHNTIHDGEIGKGEEGMSNFYLLDELLREIILRLIKYEGPRDSYKLLTK